MMRRPAWLLLFSLVAGCRCQPGPVEPIELGLRVQPAELDFGRALEGTTKVATVTLTAATRAAISVELSTDAPFDVVRTAEVPGGGDIAVAVSFRAGNTEESGVLRLTVGDRTAELPLHGIGVRPPDCRPSAVCVVSVYSLEEDRCIESQAADDAPCDTASVCLEQGRCRSGQCLGIARKCDDNDKCTDDACAMDLGCIHTPHVCPAPGVSCRVATCDPTGGCGDGPAPDLTPCGPQDCIEVNFCFSGVCQTQPTPEGLPCSPAIACLPEAQCHNQVCTRPTAADWTPAWSARLGGEPAGELASSGSTLFFSICVDGGMIDAGPFDAGVDAGIDDGGSDAGNDDAGLGDAGLDDAGLGDAGLDDAGVDGGPVDPQPDAGPPPDAWQLACSLASYTGTGFERFERDGGPQPQDYRDGTPRSVLAINAQGVVVRREGGLELRSPVTGALRSELAFDPARSSIVVERERVLFWADGGVQAWVDGGVTWLAALEEPTALGRGAALFAWNPDAGVLTRFAFLDDGGVEREELSAPVSTPALAVTGEYAVFGSAGRALVDAGLVSFDWTGADATRFLDELTLSSPQATDVFFLRCDGGCGGPDQETHVRVFDTLTGTPLWESPILTPSAPGAMLATTLIDSRPGTFATVIRSETALGPRTVAALYSEGERKALCRLPDTSGAVELAHFSATALVVTVRRPDGGVVLESYELGALPVSRTSWATPQGVSGTRTDRP